MNRRRLITWASVATALAALGAIAHRANGPWTLGRVDQGETWTPASWRFQR